MKNSIKSLAIAMVSIVCANNAFAQASVNATANAYATIVAPLTITRTAHMNFGNIAAYSGGGTVTIAPSGSRSLTGSVGLPATTGTVGAASFDVTGEPSFTYSIDIAAPASPYLIGDGAGTLHTMEISSLLGSPVAGSLTGTLSGAGTQTIKVGATITVASGQVPGTYTTAVGTGGSGPFTVTINY